MLQHIVAIVFGPMTPILLLIATTFVLRWYDGNFGLGIGVNVRPTPEQLDTYTPAFCAGLENSAVARSNIFYYDLGGTYCACEKQWNVQEYWGKTFSGLAFNLPHFIDLITAVLVYGDFRFACFLIFLNEWIEELVVAVSPHWGFNGDPYMDLEPRYDTLMRDVIHGFMGMWLASSVMHVTASRGYADLAGALSRPLFDTESARRNVDAGVEGGPVGLIPLRWQDWLLVFTKEGNRVCAEDPSSPIRLLRMHLAFFGCWRQMFMIYNLDAGIRAFSFQNVCLSVLVSLWFAIMYQLNKSHMPDVPVTRLVVQHMVPALICAGACLACVYPPMPTIYLIMMIEGSSKMTLIVFELGLLAFPTLRGALHLDVEKDSVDVGAFLRASRVPEVPLRTLLAELFSSSLQQQDMSPQTRGINPVGNRVLSPSFQQQGTPRQMMGMYPVGGGVMPTQRMGMCPVSGEVEGNGLFVMASATDAEVSAGDGTRKAYQDTGNILSARQHDVEERVRAVLERLRAAKVSGSGVGLVQQLGPGGLLRVGFNSAFALFLIVLSVMQPLTYTGTKSLSGKAVSVQYARHWCGNPKGVQFKKNTCLSSDNASDSGH